MKTIEKAILLGLILTVLFSLTGFSGKCATIEEKVFRLHVLANSDSDEDQALKLKVRDKIIEYSDDLFKDVDTREEAEQIALYNLDNIKEVALNEIHNQGYDYNVTVKLENVYFNTRHYKEVTLPAGNYDALRVIIGSGKGQNWWCVMFPQMCLPTAEEPKELSNVLNDAEMDLVEGGTKYELKFKCIETFESLRNQIETFQRDNWLVNGLDKV